MRPLYLEINGINSFSTKQCVDFRALGQNNIFCIVGNTGSGKTTIFDCVALALFEKDNRRGNYADIINLKTNKASVVFEFAYGGIEYRIAKEFTHKGVSRAEIRRLDTGEVLASVANEVSEYVKTLLNIDRRRFTQCVMLEQGRFDKFLTSTPAERYAAVEGLFRLEMYGRDLRRKVSKLVLARENELSKISGALMAFAGENEENLTQIKQKIGELKKDKKQLGELKENAKKALDAVRIGRTKTIELISAKNKIEALRGQLQALNAKKNSHEQNKQKYEQYLNKKTEQLKGFSAAQARLEKIQKIKDDNDEFDSLGKSLIKKRTEYKNAVDKREADIKSTNDSIREGAEKINELNARIDSLTKQIKQAESELDCLTKTKQAESLKRVLKKGDSCPVCGGVVESIVLNDYDETDEQAKKLRELRDSFENASKELSVFMSAYSVANERLKNLTTQGAEHLASIENEGKAIKEAVDKIIALRREILGDMDIEKAEAATKDVLKEYEDFERELDRLGKLCGEGELSITKEEATIAATLGELEKHIVPVDEVSEDNLKNSENAFKDVEKRYDEAVAELARAQERATAAKRRLEQKRVFSEQKKTAEAEFSLAETLSKLLGDNSFFEYVAEEYIAELSAFAGDLLFELSGGKFTLEYNEKYFYVKDFLNDNRTRPITTLSGGEMFLASLSCAISISRLIAKFSTFEFFFLDEGFGTLSTNALDSVCSALYSLSAQTMVGIITHSRELIEKIPSRLNVINEGNGSVVEITV